MPMPTPIPVVILAGQSNAANSSLSIGVMQSVADHGGLIIQQAVGGAPLSDALDRGTGDWAAPNGELYLSMIAQADAMLDPNSPTYIPGAYIAAVVWVQGEADTWSAAASKLYLANLTAMAADLTKRYGPLEFVISGLSDNVGVIDTPDGRRLANWNTVQAAQVAFDQNVAHSTLIDPDALAAANKVPASAMFRSDGLHYSPRFGPILGQALGDAAFALPQTMAAQARAVAPPHLSYKIGTSGNDTFSFSKDGIYQAFGATGTDCVKLGAGMQPVEVIGSGKDVIRVYGHDRPDSLMIDLVSVEKIFLTKGADHITLDGLAIRIAAGAGDDVMIGSTADDTVWLDAGNDRFDGRGGNDIAYGGAGKDSLAGGGGDDTLVGGSGADVFIFRPNGGNDIITDFQDRSDKIDLSGYDITFADLGLTAIGRDVLITLPDGDSILLQKVALKLLDPGDFLF